MHAAENPREQTCLQDHLGNPLYAYTYDKCKCAGLTAETAIIHRRNISKYSPKLCAQAERCCVQGGEGPLRIWGEDAIVSFPGAQESIIDERDAYMARTIRAAAQGTHYIYEWA